MKAVHSFVLPLGLMCFSALTAGRAEHSEVGFNRDIRPILSSHCFACHGPNEHDRKAGLRLDQRESAVAAREGGVVIDLEDVEESLLLKRIESDDLDEIMPPPDSHQRLDEQEKVMLRRWIEQGAPYERHWSLESPVRPSPPPVDVREGITNAIDRFIRAQLESEGLKPSPPADRQTWLRRVSFDLTGAWRRHRAMPLPSFRTAISTLASGRSTAC